MSGKEFRRKLHRAFEEINATREIAKYTSWGEAINSFRAKIDIQIMCRNGLQEPENVKRRLLKKHATTLNYFERKYKYYWENYNLPKMEEAPKNLRNKIWVCWWQGIENAPQIVKNCLASIAANCKDYDIIEITLENYLDYVSFPPVILEKFCNGQITKTQFSDLLRMNLLSRYGGMWLDSTLLATGDISEYMQMELWSVKRPDYLHVSITMGRFTGYAISCRYENRWIFRPVFDFMCHYWTHNNMMVDYFLFHYAVVLSMKMFPEMNNLFELIPPNNPDNDELLKLMPQIFDEKMWERLKSDTRLFKLTWKSSYPMTVNGQPTFYGKLMSGELI